MKRRGISLIVLVITIIIIIILSATVILSLTGNNPIDNASKATIMSDIDSFQSDLTINIGAKYAKNTMLDLDDVDVTGEDNELWKEYIPSIIGKKVEGEKYTKILEIKNGALVFKAGESSSISEEVKEIVLSAVGGRMSYPVLADGSWDEEKGVNSPKVEGTGLIPVYWNGSSWVDLTTVEDPAVWENNWYDYSSQQWANAMSKDGSMWVWIPRYEYKQDYKPDEEGVLKANVCIEINFIKTDITEGSEENLVVHPAFTSDVNKGGWDKELPGIWIAKYQAGFQASTTNGNKEQPINSSDSIVYSSLKYSSVNGTYNKNAIGQTITTSEYLSYPVFKPGTYSYNNISASDAFDLSKTIDTASFYGLSNVDSHLIKNSEWGAVIYLSKSIYGGAGLNGVDPFSYQPAVNNGNLNNLNGKQVLAITGYNEAGGISTGAESTTSNMTGIFDMRGAAWENTATVLELSAVDNDQTIRSYCSSMLTNTSNKYITVYPADYTQLLGEFYGDALFEVSPFAMKNISDGHPERNLRTAWISGISKYFETNRAVLGRGGIAYAISNSDIFNNAVTDNTGFYGYNASVGDPVWHVSFRAALAF